MSVELVPPAVRTGRWKPLLEGADAERALAAVRDIAAALSGDLDRVASLGAWAAGGGAGIALFFTALGEVTGDTAATETALTLVDRVIDQVGEADQAAPTSTAASPASGGR